MTTNTAIIKTILEALDARGHYIAYDSDHDVLNSQAHVLLDGESDGTPVTDDDRKLLAALQALT